MISITVNGEPRQLEAPLDCAEFLARLDLAGKRVALERKLRTVRGYQGVTCSLELAFDYNARMYVYELRPDWYEDFLNVCDDIASRLPVRDEEDGSFDEYYGNNN